MSITTHPRATTRTTATRAAQRRTLAPIESVFTGARPGSDVLDDWDDTKTTRLHPRTEPRTRRTA